MSKYDNIKHLTRPHYADFPPMPISDRAVQFSPFAALTGYEDAITETEKLIYSEYKPEEKKVK